MDHQKIYMDIEDLDLGMGEEAIDNSTCLADKLRIGTGQTVEALQMKHHIDVDKTKDILIPPSSEHEDLETSLMNSERCEDRRWMLRTPHI